MTMVLAAAAIGLEAVFIVLLLIRQARRRHAEQEWATSGECMNATAESANTGMSGWHVKRDKVRETVRRAPQRTHGFLKEYCATPADGRIGWVATRERGHHAREREAKVQGASIDVIERKRVEESLRESEARFRAMADTAPVMIWMSDPARLCTFFNKPWLDFTGRTLEQEMGNGWSEGVHPDDLGRCMDVYVTSFDARKDFTMEYRLRRRDGEYCWILDTGVPQLGDDGAFLGYIGSCIDITDRRQVEEKFRRALEFLPIAILMVDQQGRIVLANEKTEKLFGYRRDELSGKPATMLVSQLLGGSDSTPQATLSSIAQSGAVGAPRDLFARRKDGTEFLIEAGLNSLRIEDEVALLAVIVDGSERYELYRNQQELAHVTRVSTMGELAASLAHELNQPLTAIQINAQAAQRFMATDAVDLAEVREILNDIVRDNDRASEVIRRIRALVKKGEREIASLDPAAVIRDVVLLLHSDAILRGVRVSLDIDANLPRVRGDKVQLQQVMLNLLLNAFDAMESRPASDRVVAVFITLESPRIVRVAVRDRGPGLSSDQPAMIFKPFFTSKREGLGLGLSISRSIIEMHGGRLWAENNADQGATFYFTLPVGDATQPDGLQP
ncbi:PAS domain-containing sensor histidine kinase [Paraburkholderia hospita]|uniref:PAS domain-containing sensor histidine kinase n=1 Tax=Paraburkholderia hospita TaxID=169430 RepID=UPI0008A7BA31|nr:PAS domain S-box protein [Paraburkholderia hospita]SEI28625.1 PAS domain S-box-containing protein [Paraburkholderia hospita]